MHRPSSSLAAALASFLIALQSGGLAASTRRHTSTSGGWTLTGSLLTPRVQPMAATLPSGKVLVAGGLDNKNHAIGSAELFDPKTGRWSRTGSMTLARVQSTMTLLRSGKVLVAGGDGPSGNTNAAELYDTATGRWKRTAPMGTARANHSATLLADGRVLVAGGVQASGGSRNLASAELYDSTTGKWSATGSMSTARESHTAALLLNGQVLVSGGNIDLLNGAEGSSEIFDPTAGKWSTVGRMMTSRALHVSVTLADGSVIVAGGEYGNFVGFNPLAMTDRYDPATGIWSPAGDMQVAQGATPHLAGRDFHSATPLADGRVLVAGGFGYITDFTKTVILDTAEIFDPTSGTWSLTGNMNDARAQHAAVVLKDGRTLVAGGYAFGPPLASAEIFAPGTRSTTPAHSQRYRPVTAWLPASRLSYHVPRPVGVMRRLTARLQGAIGKWTLTGSMHVGRAFAPATLLPNGKVLVEGCDAFDVGGTTAELYDPATRKWAMTGSMHVARCLHSAILLPNGHVLVAGGHSGASVWSNMETYDPQTGTWSLAGDLNSPRADSALALLPSGTVLAPAGFAVNTIPRDSADLYNSASQSSVATPSLQISRWSYAAIALRSGKVLVAGGVTQNSSNTLTSELYDPVSNVWSYTGPVINGIQVSVLLQNGLVLATSPPQLYSPTKGRWSLTGVLDIPRINNTLSVLQDGRVLIAGGCTGVSSCQLVTESELYDPHTQRWSPDAIMNVGRESQSAALLPNGQVLVAGGFGVDFQQLTSAELYTEGPRR